MKKTTFFNLLLSLCVLSGFGQTMVNDFETETGTGFTLVQASGTVVDNPTKDDMTSANTTSKCLKIGRTGTNWWELTRINLDPNLTGLNGSSKFLSVMAYYGNDTGSPVALVSDIGCRFNASADDNNGTNQGVIRSTNLHSGNDDWEQIVIEVRDDKDLPDFKTGTLYTLVFHADMQARGLGTVLNNTDAFLYIDQIQILDSNPLLSNEEFALERNISIYQNASLSSFRIETKNNINIADVSLYDILGSKVNNISKIDTHEYDMSNLSSGLYIVKIRDDRGESFGKKLMKQ